LNFGAAVWLLTQLKVFQDERDIDRRRTLVALKPRRWFRVLLRAVNKNLIAKVEDRIFLIECDLPEVGAYFRVYENGKDIADHLQDSVQDCIQFALEEFSVPRDALS
jgi:hypothetical protein